VLSLAAAFVTFKLIENPARSLRLPNPQWFAGGLVLSGSAVLAAVVVIANLPPLVGTGRDATVVRASVATPAVTREMKAAIIAGLSTNDAPRNLTPEPAQAHGDVPISSFDGCHADLMVITQGPCAYGDKKSKDTVVLFGDSHMQQWQPAFIRAGVGTRWRVVNWTKSGCAPQEGVERSGPQNAPYTQCNTWRPLTLRRIAALKPTVVVVASADVEEPYLSPDAYADATVATMRTLQRTTNAKIVYLEDTPYPAYNVADCVAAHLSDVKACNLPLSKAYNQSRHQAVNRALRKLGGVILINPEDWICADHACPAVVGNLLVFRDQSHISVEFSRWLSPMISSMLDELRPKPAGHQP